MTEERQASQVTVEEARRYAAELLAGGLNSAAVKNRLMEAGVDEPTARAAVADALQLHVGAHRDAARKDMIYGALWCIGGTLVTVITYTAASGGGTYVVAWGAIIFGGIQFFRGLIAYNK